MNKIYMVKRNKLGQSVVTSELAKSKGKLSSVAKVVGLAILGLSSSAFAETTNEITTYGQGATAQTGGTAIGVKATADTNGTAIGQQATASTQATANGYVAAALANETIAIGVNSGAVGGGLDKATFEKLNEADQNIKNTDPNDYTKEIEVPIVPSNTPVNEAKTKLDSALNDGLAKVSSTSNILPAKMWAGLPDTGDDSIDGEINGVVKVNPTTLTGDIANAYNKLVANSTNNYTTLSSSYDREASRSLINFLKMNEVLKEMGVSSEYIIDDLVKLSLGTSYSINNKGHVSINVLETLIGVNADTTLDDIEK